MGWVVVNIFTKYNYNIIIINITCGIKFNTCLAKGGKSCLK